MIAAIDGVRQAGERFLAAVSKRTAAASNGWLPNEVRGWFDLEEHPATADVLRGVAAGMAGGLIASWAMNRFQALVSWDSEKRERREHRPGGNEPVAEDENGKRASDSESGEEPATVQVAEAVSRRVAQHELTSHEKRVAGPAVHYAYGTVMGGVYGGLVEAAPAVETGFGTAYGTALWLIGDEIAIPALGMGKPPAQTAPSEHGKALAAHVVYGLTLEGVRRLVRRML
jgi:hypothetical protein